MEEEYSRLCSSSSAATVFQMKLHQNPADLQFKMSLPKLCRRFSATAWCGKLNAIACASETCARIPSSNVHPPFWIPMHIVNPERPTECANFNIIADSPRDSVQFIEWSPVSCPRALLVANFYGRISIWSQPSQEPSYLVRDSSCWQCEHEWHQEIAVLNKWLSGISPYQWVSSNFNSPENAKSNIEEIFSSQRPQTSARWPNFLCVCSVYSTGSVQLHWSEWPRSQSRAAPKWFSTGKCMLGAGPSGIMAADAIITEAGTMHVAGVPICNPSTVVVWEVGPGYGNGLHGTALISTSNAVPQTLSPPCWAGYAPLAANLFSWQDYFGSKGKQAKKQTDLESSETVPLHCSPVSNFSAYVSPEAAATTSWGSGVSAVAFDPARGGSVISVVIVEGNYMSPCNCDEGPSVTGFRVQSWESSLQPVVLHPIFGNSVSSCKGEEPMRTVWKNRVNRRVPHITKLEVIQEPASMSTSSHNQSTCHFHDKKDKRLSCDPLDLPSDNRTFAQIVYTAHGGEAAISFFGGEVHIFSGASFSPVEKHGGTVVSAITSPSFSSTGSCLAFVWHDTCEDCTMLKITRALPPALYSKSEVNSATWERAIADRFWWSLVAGVDWWDAVGWTQSAAEDGIVSLNSVIAVLDADFHSLSSSQHRQQHCPSLDRIKCRLLEGTSAQDVRALVLDMQARLLLDMLGKGIEAALINPATLVAEPWLATSEMISSIEPDAMMVEPALVCNIQVYDDTILDLASHFITRLRRYASFCRTLASASGKNAGVGSGRNLVTTSMHSSASPSPGQGPGSQSGTTSSTQMQWVQGAIAKINSNIDAVSNSAINSIGGPPTFTPPISVNTGTFPGTPAVRLIGDCHFIRRLCQLLMFCYMFWRRQTRYKDSRQMPGMVKSEDNVDGQGVKGADVGGPQNRIQRIGSGNAGYGYTHEEVKVLLLIVVELCKRTTGLAHPFPLSQVGGSLIQIRLHYIDGTYTVLPEVVEASIGPHMQNMPRPKGADAAGLLLRELELHPPAEEWHRRNFFGEIWSNSQDMGRLKSCDSYYGPHGLWPKKRRLSERDAAFGLNNSMGLGPYLGLMGSRRDVLTSVWKNGLEGVWYKCIRCLRQTSAFTPQPNGNDQVTCWINRWAYCCPLCDGSWVRVV